MKFTGNLKNLKDKLKEGNTRIGVLIAAGLLTLNLTGCEINEPAKPRKTNISRDDEDKREIQALRDGDNEDLIRLGEFRKELQESFSTLDVTLNKYSDEFISDIVIDGTNVTIELIDGSTVSGVLNNLEISNVNFENFYIYDSKYVEDYINCDTIYKNYEEDGYDSAFSALLDDYANHEKLNLETKYCSVTDEYKKGSSKDVKWHDSVDYSDCKKVWLEDTFLEENWLEEISSMPNLETLILTNYDCYGLEGEVFEIHSNSLKNIIIDGSYVVHYIDKFDFTRCPNLEIVSIPSDTQEENLDYLNGLDNLKEVAFGLPLKYNIKGLILNDFQERIDMVSESFPTNDESLAYPLNCFISDISAINGANIETLNISFLKCVTSDMLLETVKSLPNLKQIVGFEVNNAGMCSDELIRYCEENGITHPFTEKSLEIKHKLQEIVANLITEDMDEEEKIRILSEYIVSHMEYNFDLANEEVLSPEEARKGWGECLYYSVIEGDGVCQGYTMYAQNLFMEAGITAFKSETIGHTYNLVQVDDDFWYIDLTNIDEIIDEEISSSFSNYDLEDFYLVPIESENFYYSHVLPLEAEEKYNKARESEGIEDTEKLEKIKVGNYMIKTGKQDLNPEKYSKLCGTIGILCALRLAKPVTNPKEFIKNLGTDARTSENKDVIKVSSLKGLIGELKRLWKIEELRKKREAASFAKKINREAKSLENACLERER